MRQLSFLGGESVSIKGISYSITVEGKHITGSQRRRIQHAAEMRNVRVSAEMNGSGVIVETGMVVTAYHLAGHESVIKVNNRVAQVLRYDRDADLMLLAVKTRKVSPILFSERYEKGEPVFYVGNPEFRTGYVSYSTIGWYSSKEICTDNLSLHGFSGAALNKAATGETIGILVEMDGANDTGRPMACAVPASKVIKLLRDEQTARASKLGLTG